MSAGTQQVPVPWTPAPPQLVMAYSVCKGITRRAAKNFYYAFLVLPRRKREALCAVYAFMRLCDDITDDPKLSLPERRQKLESWLDALHFVYTLPYLGRTEETKARVAELRVSGRFEPARRPCRKSRPSTRRGAPSSRDLHACAGIDLHVRGKEADPRGPRFAKLAAAYAETTVN